MFIPESQKREIQIFRQFEFEIEKVLGSPSDVQRVCISTYSFYRIQNQMLNSIRDKLKIFDANPKNDLKYSKFSNFLTILNPRLMP